MLGAAQQHHLITYGRVSAIAYYIRCFIFNDATSVGARAKCDGSVRFAFAARGAPGARLQYAREQRNENLISQGAALHKKHYDERKVCHNIFIFYP